MTTATIKETEVQAWNFNLPTFKRQAENARANGKLYVNQSTHIYTLDGAFVGYKDQVVIPEEIPQPVLYLKCDDEWHRRSF